MEYHSNPDGLLAGFVAAGGWYDKELFDLRHLPDMGLSAVALQDIPDECPLFRIPDSCILAPSTSNLKDRLTTEEWAGLSWWSRLILVMMWESAQPDSQWAWYLRSLPTKFNTPMFWSDSERLELTGTEIEDRIGLAEAEALYFDTLQPLIKSRSDIFDHDEKHYSMEAFHIQGSRILSRSFNIPSPDDVESESSDSEAEEEQIPAMFPIADALNAASNCNNARLFNEDSDVYTMTSTQSIAAGAQIYNTYMELPNSELLRKYGYCDTQAMSSEITDRLEKHHLLEGYTFGNPFDEAILGADRILHIASQQRGLDLTERVDWWLEEGQDDAFSVSLTAGVDVAFHAFARLLLSDAEWRKAKKRSRLPDTEPNPDSAMLLQQVIDDRMSKYRTSLHDDIQAASPEQDPTRRAALAVRIGEKRALLLCRAESEVAEKQVDEARPKKRAKP